MHSSSLLPLTVLLIAGTVSAQTVFFQNPAFQFNALSQQCQQTITNLFQSHSLHQCLPQDALSGLVQSVGGPTTNGVANDGWVNGKDPTAPLDQGWAVSPGAIEAEKKNFVGSGNSGGFPGSGEARATQVFGVLGTKHTALLSLNNYQMSLTALCSAPKCNQPAVMAAAAAIRQSCAGSPYFTLTTLPWALDNYELLREISCLRAQNENFCVVESATGISPFMNPMQAGAQSPGFTLESLDAEPNNRICSACQKNIVTLTNQYNDKYPGRLAEDGVVQRGRQWFANHCGRWFLDGRMDFYSAAAGLTGPASAVFAVAATSLAMAIL